MYQWVLIWLHINVWYSNILSKFNFQVAGLKVKVIVAIFRKKDFVIALAPAFINISSHICGYDNISSRFDFQGPGLKVKLDRTEIFSIIWDLIPLNLKI